MNQPDIYDFVIVGSGFGGSVSAMRLSEKGYSVLILERGKRFNEQNLPKTNWDIKNYIWLPALGCYGILEMSLSRGYFVYHGSGVGGGSLVYAAVLMEPGDEFFSATSWSKYGDWKQILAPHYETARRMLGVEENPKYWSADYALEKVAKQFNYQHTFHPTEVGIFIGEEGKTVPDPYFDGQGPERTGCNYCGGCIVACRYNSKNSLDKNYLFFAEKYGAKIKAEAEVTSIIPLEAEDLDFDQARYAVNIRKTTEKFGRKEIIYAKNVILSAGVLGTLSLLLSCRDQHCTLPNLSEKLGMQVRTNSEAFLGAFNPKGQDNHSIGLSISSIFYAGPTTQVEPVRCPDGSSLLFWLLSSPMIKQGGNLFVRFLKTLVEIIKYPLIFIDAKFRPGLARRGIALMIMQTEDNQMQIKLGRNPFALFKKGLIANHATNHSVPINIELGNQVARSFANEIGGYATGTVTEGLLHVPMTAHILGGCNFGETDRDGVVGLDFQVHNYPGLYVVDGSIVPANLGVNPSLTITALAEYAMSQIPPKN